MRDIQLLGPWFAAVDNNNYVQWNISRGVPVAITFKSLIFMGAASLLANPSLGAEKWQECQLIQTLTSPAVDKNTVLHKLWLTRKQQELLLIQRDVFGCPCSSGPRLAGASDQPRWGGASDQPRLAGASDQPRLGGASDQPRLAGASDQPRLAGASDQPRLAGASDQPRLAGASDQPRLGGASDQPRLAGASDQPRLDGASDQPRLAGAADQPRLAGASDQPRLGGKATAPMCKIDPHANRGYELSIAGLGKVSIYDGYSVQAYQK